MIKELNAWSVRVWRWFDRKTREIAGVGLGLYSSSRGVPRATGTYMSSDASDENHRAGPQEIFIITRPVPLFPTFMYSQICFVALSNRSLLSGLGVQFMQHCSTKSPQNLETLGLETARASVDRRTDAMRTEAFDLRNSLKVIAS